MLQDRTMPTESQYHAALSAKELEFRKMIAETSMEPGELFVMKELHDHVVAMIDDLDRYRG